MQGWRSGLNRDTLCVRGAVQAFLCKLATYYEYSINILRSQGTMTHQGAKGQYHPKE